MPANFLDTKTLIGLGSKFLGKKIGGKLGLKTGSAPATTGSTDPALSNRNYTVIIKQDQDAFAPPGKPRIVVGQVPASFAMSQDVNWKAPWGGGLASVGGDTVANLLAVTGNRMVGQAMTLQVWQGSNSDFDFTVAFEFRAYSDVVRDVIDPVQTLLKMSLPSISPTTGFLQSPGPILGAKAIEKIGGDTVKILGAVKDLGVAAASSLLSGAGGLLSSVTAVTKNVGTVVDGAKSLAGSALNNVSAYVPSELTTALGAAGGVLKNSSFVSKAPLESEMKNKISIQIGRWFRLDNVVITNVQHDIRPHTVTASGGLQTANVTVSFRPVFSLTEADVASMFGNF